MLSHFTRTSKKGYSTKRSVPSDAENGSLALSASGSSGIFLIEEPPSDSNSENQTQTQSSYMITKTNSDKLTLTCLGETAKPGSIMEDFLIGLGGNKRYLHGAQLRPNTTKKRSRWFENGCRPKPIFDVVSAVTKDQASQFEHDHS
ncbi:hypothetical protein I302_105433 [Kwoniella bestiolae CBS 10118]|uniref:Uncharacterized protein n=1 Tax=Kwoniella bestiolae CBS 10118 TaxID=1296100 RepID=A0A1B9FT38_9TREE|nr:hypothetical protein I302_08714 [Kwoniella bestiolae CBS 10118]OCF21935.1 hypothetical protein I302_08714 [Kwoniella bestiolae CBS 10118]